MKHDNKNKANTRGGKLMFNYYNDFTGNRLFCAAKLLTQ